MQNWLREFLVGPHVVIFAGIIFTLIAEILRYAGSKKENTKIENIGLFVLIAGLLISGVGGWWAAKEQSTFQQRILDSVTGGDSYCYIMPLTENSGWTTLMLKHEGDNPLYDISVKVLNLSKLTELPFDKIRPPMRGEMKKEEWQALMREKDYFGNFSQLTEKATFRLELSILTPTMGYQFERFLLPKETLEQKYLVQIWSRNGSFSQTIRFRQINGQWGYSMRVKRNSGGDKKSIVLYEQISPEIPLKDNE